MTRMTRGRIRRRQVLHDERGSVAIFTISCLSLAIAIILYLAYYYGGFVSLRQAQNVADSAALAAAQELRDRFVAQMQDKTLATVRTFIRKLREEVEACEIERKPGDPPCPTVDDLIKLYIKQSELERILLANKYDKAEHWLLVVAEPQFHFEYTPEANGDVLYETFLQQQQIIVRTALEAAARNNGEQRLLIRFPVDGRPKLEVNGVKAMQVKELDGGQPAWITAKAAAGIEPQAFEVDVSRKIPKTIRKH
jgi:hypothetical protein